MGTELDAFTFAEVNAELLFEDDEDFEFAQVGRRGGRGGKGGKGGRGRSFSPTRCAERVESDAESLKADCAGDAACEARVDTWETAMALVCAETDKCKRDVGRRAAKLTLECEGDAACESRVLAWATAKTNACD